MDAKDAFRNTIAMSDLTFEKYLDDLDDADLLVRPVPGMNHIAWQLGHLIGAERFFVEAIRPGSCPPLPDGFSEAHARDRAAADGPDGFLPKARYQELWKAQRAATLAVLDDLPASELDRSDEKFPPFAPTVGALLNMVGVHPLMHCGQFVAVRRALGKPIAI